MNRRTHLEIKDLLYCMLMLPCYLVGKAYNLFVNTFRFVYSYCSKSVEGEKRLIWRSVQIKIFITVSILVKRVYSYIYIHREYFQLPHY